MTRWGRLTIIHANHSTYGSVSSMTITNNFVSVVTLGSFNPAILTPEFVKKQSIYQFEVPPEGETSPVISQLTFGNVRLLVELERLQVLEKDPDDFTTAKALSITTAYLNVLKHTPVLIQGINFNVTISNYAESQALACIFSDPVREIVKHLDTSDEYRIDVQTYLSNNIPTTHSVTCKYFVEKGVSMAVNLKRSDSSVLLNFNYEVRDIDKDTNRNGLIAERYQAICDRFAQLLRSLTG